MAAAAAVPGGLLANGSTFATPFKRKSNARGMEAKSDE